MKNKKIKILVEGAMMVALATVLSFFKLWQFPWGGSITVLSMLPIVVFALRYGVLKGLTVSFVYSAIQLALGVLFEGLLGWGLTPTALIACIFLDYIGAFSILCLAGAFGNKKMVSVIGGTVLVMVLRFSLHYFSGVLIFNSFGELWEGFSTDNTWLYSLLYNGAYMLPETVFTTLGALLLFKTPQMRKLLIQNDND